MARRKRWPIDHVLTADDLALNITFACDLACVGCNRGSFLKPAHTPPMTTDRLLEVIADAKQSGIAIRRMRVIGGEPTIHPQFMEFVRIAVEYARSVAHDCRVRIYSNVRSERAKRLVKEAKEQYPEVRLWLDGAKTASVVFPPLTRYGYVSPLDHGIKCPHPCPIMGGRGQCGYGVDQLGYSLCPMAGTIDTLLGLNARAKRLAQLKDLEYVTWQADRICSNCGNYMAYKDLPKLTDCNGTPVSESFRSKMGLS